MSVKRLKWSDLERNLLLNYVTGEIVKGVTISIAIETFSNTYDLPVSSVRAQWQIVSEQNKLLVAIAKHTWKTQGKVEKEEQLKKQKKAEMDRQRTLRERKKYREQKLKNEKKKLKKVKVIIPTNKKVHPMDKGLLVKVDANGLVHVVK